MRNHIHFAVVDTEKSKEYPLNFVCVLPQQMSVMVKQSSAFAKIFGDKSISRFLIPILEGYDERALLKIGSSKWKYEAGREADALTYFRDAGNQWIRSIALFIEEKALKHAA